MPCDTIHCFFFFFTFWLKHKTGKLEVLFACWVFATLNKISSCAVQPGCHAEIPSAVPWFVDNQKNEHCGDLLSVIGWLSLSVYCVILCECILASLSPQPVSLWEIPLRVNDLDSALQNRFIRYVLLSLKALFSPTPISTRLHPPDTWTQARQRWRAWLTSAQSSDW